MDMGKGMKKTMGIDMDEKMEIIAGIESIPIMKEWMKRSRRRMKKFKITGVMAGAIGTVLLILLIYMVFTKADELNDSEAVCMALAALLPMTASIFCIGKENRDVVCNICVKKAAEEIMEYGMYGKPEDEKPEHKICPSGWDAQRKLMKIVLKKANNERIQEMLLTYGFMQPCMVEINGNEKYGYDVEIIFEGKDSAWHTKRTFFLYGVKVQKSDSEKMLRYDFGTNTLFIKNDLNIKWEETAEKSMYDKRMKEWDFFERWIAGAE